MTRSHRIKVRGTPSSIKLEDLRWLVDNSESLPGNTTVHLQVDSPSTYHPTDIGSSELSIDIPERSTSNSINGPDETPRGRSQLF